LDDAPYDASADTDGREEILPLLDWSKQGKPPEMARIQRELFDNHRILLVERSAEFMRNVEEAEEPPPTGL